MVQIRDSENMVSSEIVQITSTLKKLIDNNPNKDGSNQLIQLLSNFSSLLASIIQDPHKQSNYSLPEEETADDLNGYQENDRVEAEVQPTEHCANHLNGYQINDREKSHMRRRDTGRADYSNGYQQYGREASHVHRRGNDRAIDQHKSYDKQQPVGPQRSKQKNVGEKPNIPQSPIFQQPRFDAFAIIPKVSEDNELEENWNTPKTVTKKFNVPQESWRNPDLPSSRFSKDSNVFRSRLESDSSKKSSHCENDNDSRRNGKKSQPSPIAGPSKIYKEKQYAGEENWDTQNSSGIDNQIEISNNTSLRSIHLIKDNSEFHPSIIEPVSVDIEDNFVGHECNMNLPVISVSANQEKSPKRSKNPELTSTTKRSKQSSKRTRDDGSHNISSSSLSRGLFLQETRNQLHKAKIPEKALYVQEVEAAIREKSILVREKSKEIIPNEAGFKIPISRRNQETKTKSFKVSTAQSNKNTSQKSSVKPQKPELTPQEKSIRDEAERKRMFLLNNFHPYFPRIGGAFMVGDDYFLRVARNQLEHGLDPNYSNCQSGYCISGQTIKEAFEMICDRKLPDETILLINVGYEDILRGHDFFDMVEPYENLLSNCKNRGIVPIVVTLAPLPNATISQNSNLKRLNGWIKKQPLHIDISNCMIARRGDYVRSLYYSKPKYVSGSKFPYTFWNKMGEKRVLECIKDKLADFMSGHAITDYKQKIKHLTLDKWL